jgi:hypothetical protein
MGERRGAHRALLGKERDHFGGTGVDGRILLRWIFRKCDVRVWTGWSWFRIGTVGGYLCLR